MARFDGGWIKIWRKSADSDLIANQTLWALWHWLLVHAIWKPSKILWNGKQRELAPGTVVFSPKELAALWGCSRSVITKWLHYLHDTQRIVTTASPRGTIVTICNWDLYQSKDEEITFKRDNGVSTACLRRDNGEALSEEGKKERKEERKNTAAFDFETLYKKYPRKEGKGQGIKQCQKQILTQAEYDSLSISIDRYAKHCEGTQQIVKHFGSFLGSDRTGNPWRDWLEADAGVMPTVDSNGQYVDPEILKLRRELEEEMRANGTA